MSQRYYFIVRGISFQKRSGSVRTDIKYFLKGSKDSVFVPCPYHCCAIGTKMAGVEKLLIRPELLGQDIMTTCAQMTE